MDPRLLMRAKRLAQHPPSWRRVLLLLGVIAACLALWGIERTLGFPEWLAPNDARRLSR